MQKISVDIRILFIVQYIPERVGTKDEVSVVEIA